MSKYPRVCDLQIKCKWTKRFMQLAAMVATWSKSPGTKVGAVIVRPDKTICSVGFNGFPQGMDDSESRYLDQEFKHSCILHAEVNAILSSKEPLNGYSLITFPVMPCDRCAAMIIRAGITKVVCPVTDGTANMGAKPYEMARQHLREAKVYLREIPLK